MRWQASALNTAVAMGRYRYRADRTGAAKWRGRRAAVGVIGRLEGPWLLGTNDSARATGRAEMR